MRERKFYLIPLSLVELVFRERLYREFQIWMELKHRSNGHLKITPDIVRSVANELKISPKTVSRTIEKLRQRNWIGYNPKSGFSFIRSFKAVQIIEDLPGRLGVWFDVDRKKESRGFIAGSVISKLVREQRKKVWQERKGVQTKGGTFQPVRLPAFYPVSCSSLEQIYNVSTKRAWNAKKNATNGKFIQLKHVNKPLPIDRLKSYLEGYPENKGKVFRKGGNWFLRLPDLVQMKMTFGRRERVKTLKTTTKNSQDAISKRRERK